MHYFIRELSQITLGATGGFSKRAKVIYNENMSAFVKIVLRRPFSKILVGFSLLPIDMVLTPTQDYFDGVDRLLQTTAPSQISNNSNYNKAALRKVLKEYDGKDIKRLVDALYKRVEKYFNETESSSAAGTALGAVWKACEDETMAATERFTKLISQCYAGSSLTLEYTILDVKAAFKRKV